MYRISGGLQAPRSALPIGDDPVANPLRVAPVNIDRDLLHVVLAVSYAKNLIKLFLGNPSFSFSFYNAVILWQEKRSGPSNMLFCSYSVPSFIYRLVNQ